MTYTGYSSVKRVTLGHSRTPRNKDLTVNWLNGVLFQEFLNLQSFPQLQRPTPQTPLTFPCANFLIVPPIESYKSKNPPQIKAIHLRSHPPHERYANLRPSPLEKWLSWARSPTTASPSAGFISPISRASSSPPGGRCLQQLHVWKWRPFAASGGGWNEVAVITTCAHAFAISVESGVVWQLLSKFG